MTENFHEMSKVELRRIVLNVSESTERREAAVDALCGSYYASGYDSAVDDDGGE